MSVPPSQGWQPPQQPGPTPSQGPPYGQPAAPSGYNPQQPPPGWQQGSWPQQPEPPPQKGSGLKWLLIAVAVLLVIGISVGATLLFTRSDGGGTTSTSRAPSDVASANDTGPVSIITDEPTCNTFYGINNSLADVQKNGWGDQRANLGPPSEWTPEQKSQVQAVATAMQNSADLIIPLAKQTPHRLVRELYEQFIAFGRAYAESVPHYTEADDALAAANINISGALLGICTSIQTGAANRSIALGPGLSLSRSQYSGNPGAPERFITTSNQSCTKWISNSNGFDANTADWQKLDTATPASQWSSERRSMQQAALPFLSSWAQEMQQAGQESGNTVFEDFAVAANLYMRAYVEVGDSYVGSDSWLTYVGFRLNQTILAGCNATTG